MLAFGGQLTDKTYIESGAPSFYYLMNFNDFGSSLVTLFHQMVVNNWFVTVNMYASMADTGLGRAGTRLFFISIWIVIVLIQMNILIAIVLEIYGSVTD